MIKFSGLDFVKIDKSNLKSLARKIAAVKGYRIKKIQYNFVDNAKIMKINKEFLNHDEPTDIITFDYTDKKIVSAEVFISREELCANAAKNAQMPENEVVRLVSHAILHCLGYKDKTKEQKQTMREKENEYINLFHVKHTLDV